MLFIIFGIVYCCGIFVAFIVYCEPNSDSEYDDDEKAFAIMLWPILLSYMVVRGLDKLKQREIDEDIEAKRQRLQNLEKEIDDMTR